MGVLHWVPILHTIEWASVNTFRGGKSLHRRPYSFQILKGWSGTKDPAKWAKRKRLNLIEKVRDLPDKFFYLLIILEICCFKTVIGAIFGSKTFTWNLCSKKKYSSSSSSYLQSCSGRFDFLSVTFTSLQGKVFRERISVNIRKWLT